jgi:prepilin-type N-terminal cleavage/methylation domain-containing protein
MDMRTPPRHTHASHGFTLIEIAIVLVIIGLLAGGVVIGESLIRNAGLKSILTDYNKYKSALVQFRNQYQALPGDLADATEYWGQASAPCITTAGAGTATCNGNGNGLIVGSAAESYESHSFWKHLANAGMVEGSYSGVSGTGANDSNTTKLNSPSGKLSGSLWAVWNWTGVASDGGLFDGDYGNAFIIGAMSSGALPSNPLLKPEEAWNIDAKVDDGKPGIGNVRAANWGTCSNAANSADVNTTYKVTSRTIACVLIFANISM